MCAKCNDDEIYVIAEQILLEGKTLEDFQGLEEDDLKRVQTVVNRGVKSLSEHGFDLEKLSFENSFMNSNKENNNSSNKEDKNYSNQESSSTFDEDENNKDDNLNYLININA